MCRSGVRAKRKNDEACDRETLAQGDLEVEAGRRAAAGRCCRQAECSPAGTRTSTLTGGITEVLFAKVYKSSLLLPP